MIIHDQLSQVKAMQEIKDLDLSQKWEVKIDKYRENKTTQQLALYWKWVVIIGNEFGYHKDEMSEYLKEELIPPTFVKVGSKARAVRPSIATMKINQMSEFMDRVSTWAGSHGIRLPHPEDLHDT